jgi:hypothetical protein
MQPTAFGAQDRWFFEIVCFRAPRRRLMGRPFGALHQRDLPPKSPFRLL